MRLSYMPNLVALSPMVSDKKIFKDFSFFLSFIAMATRVLEGIKLFKKNSEDDHDRNISVKFHQNWISGFREDVKRKS